MIDSLQGLCMSFLVGYLSQMRAPIGNLNALSTGMLAAIISQLSPLSVLFMGQFLDHPSHRLATIAERTKLCEVALQNFLNSTDEHDILIEQLCCPFVKSIVLHNPPSEYTF